MKQKPANCFGCAGTRRQHLCRRPPRFGRYVAAMAGRQPDAPWLSEELAVRKSLKLCGAAWQTVGSLPPT